MLVDSHCHLNYPGLVEDIKGTIIRAMDADVNYMLCISTKLDEFSAILNIAETFSNVGCTVGVHPHESNSDVKTSVDALVALTEHPKVIGIGETGLDFYYNNAPRKAQEASFRTHICASRETQLPIIIHTRDADKRTIEIINEEQKVGHFPGLIHCFSGGNELAECAINYGMAISLSGIITFKTAEDIRHTVKTIPLNHLLLETDAPFLAPVPHRGKINEPAFVAHTAAKAAEILDLEPDDIAEITTNNFFNLFSKAKRSII